MERRTVFVDVIVPLALPRVFTYRVPTMLEAQAMPLQRVVVPFGKSKKYTGIIFALHEKPPKDYEAKYIESILDDKPLISRQQMEFWTWIATYYMCTLGEVMAAALPAGLKLSSETKILLPEDADPSFRPEHLHDREWLILDALEKEKELSISDVEKICGIRTIYPYLKNLLDQKLIKVEEEIKHTFKSKFETFVELTDEYASEHALNNFIEKLNRAPKQLEALLGFLSLSIQENGEKKAVSKKELILKTGNSASALVQLISKGVLKQFEVKLSRLSGNHQLTQHDLNLNPEQTQALAQLRTSFETKTPVLLHGVTSSGKTAIYIKCIEEQLLKGNQVLYLLPEIALTSQIINRLRAHFGERVQVYHSRFSEQERVEVWKAVAAAHNPQGTIILGARSSVFLPFHKLGLIIVDEEHDPSFKQQEPAPRYHARDAATQLAFLHKANILLGSATPSVETYYNTLQSKYHRVTLLGRYGGVQLPQTVLIDLKEEVKKGKMKGIFSLKLLEGIRQTLAQNNQVILFQNRRGFAPQIVCQSCHWVPQCVQCDISLTYHKQIHQLRCHYCGYSRNVPDQCDACKSNDIRTKGFGTEKIEEELQAFFPEANLARMDFDTTRSKYSYQKIMEDFEHQQVDILIGTQMITKGLDFKKVQLVGIIQADSMLNYPDFRAFERAFQMIDQVSGRAGRGSTGGIVMIQTWRTDHPVLQAAKAHDYINFIENELIQRKEFVYPPFSRIIHVTLKHENRQPLDEAADLLAAWLHPTFGTLLLGPEYPGIERIRNMYQKRIMLKVSKSLSIQKVKSHLRIEIDRFFEHHTLKGFRLIIDIDPVS